VCCVSKAKVKEEGTKKFLSPRKHINIKKRATNLEDFQKDVLSRTVLEYYDKGESLLPIKV
jgi:predicted RNA-binding protein with PUA domain